MLFWWFMSCCDTWCCPSVSLSKTSCHSFAHHTPYLCTNATTKHTRDGTFLTYLTKETFCLSVSNQFQCTGFWRHCKSSCRTWKKMQNVILRRNTCQLEEGKDRLRKWKNWREGVEQRRLKCTSFFTCWHCLPEKTQLTQKQEKDAFVDAKCFDQCKYAIMTQEEALHKDAWCHCEIVSFIVGMRLSVSWPPSFCLSKCRSESSPSWFLHR